MNVLHFTGRLAAPPTQSKQGESTLTKFRLLRNAYAGKDAQTGESAEKVVAIPFSAWGSRGDAIFSNCLVGDQLIVQARVEDYVVKKDGKEDEYGFNFTVESFDFGAPGEKKREQLASRA